MTGARVSNRFTRALDRWDGRTVLHCPTFSKFPSTLPCSLSIHAFCSLPQCVIPHKGHCTIRPAVFIEVTRGTQSRQFSWCLGSNLGPETAWNTTNPPPTSPPTSRICKANKPMGTSKRKSAKPPPQCEYAYGCVTRTSLNRLSLVTVSALPDDEE